MQYTLEQCLEQQKKVDAGINNTGTYWPWLEANGELIEFCQHMQLMGSWKKQPKKDVKQAFMECVDYFAFKLSGAIIDSVSFDIDSFRIIESFYEECSLEFLLRELFKCTDKHLFTQSIAILQLISKKCCDKDLNDLCYYYMGKKTLTQFRQKNGYKTGGYIKIWHGREDNEYLTEYLEKGLSVEEIENALEIAYSAVVRES